MGHFLLSDQLMTLLAAVLAFGWAVAIAYIRPAWIAGLALGVFAFEAVFGSLSGLNLGGILTYPSDMAFGAMAAAAALRVLVVPASVRGADRAWFVLALLALLSFGRGVQAFGPNLAGNDFRGMFYVLAALIFFATHRRDERVVRDVVDIWIGMGLLLLAVGVVRVMGLGVGAAAQQELLSGGRALYAAPTLLILQAGLMSFFVEPLASRWRRVPGLPWLLLSGVVLFQHRTVWVAMGVSLIAMWTVLGPGRDQRKSQFSRWLGGAMVAFGVVALLIAGGKLETIQSSVARSTQSTTGENSTFVWRVEGWQYLLKHQQADANSLVIGIPYGSGYHRVIEGAAVDVAPHSWYVEMISRVGVVGTFALLVALAGLFRRGRRAGLLPRNLGALLVLSTALFGLAYWPPETQGILLGVVALAWRDGNEKGQPEDEKGFAYTARGAGSSSLVHAEFGANPNQLRASSKNDETKVSNPNNTTQADGSGLPRPKNRFAHPPFFVHFSPER